MNYLIGAICFISGLLVRIFLQITPDTPDKLPYWALGICVTAIGAIFLILMNNQKKHREDLKENIKKYEELINNNNKAFNENSLSNKLLERSIEQLSEVIDKKIK